MSRSSIKARTIAIVLASGAFLGCLYLCNLWFLRGENPLALAAGCVLVLVAIAILHDSGVKTMTIAVTIGAIAALLGVYFLIVWLSLRTWDGPTW